MSFVNISESTIKRLNDKNGFRTALKNTNRINQKQLNIIKSWEKLLVLT